MLNHGLIGVNQVILLPEPPTSRRKFIKRLASLGFLSSGLPKQLLPFDQVAGDASHKLPSASLVKNRSPLAPNRFYPLPVGSITPRGWLRVQLEIQSRGLSGHLDETWPDVGSNSGWLGGTGESWERGPYYLDGLVPLAWLLDGASLKTKAMRFIDWTLENQQSNGMIGPRSNDDWWPRFVMLKALTQYQELTHDSRVIPVMERYFLYQLKELPSRPLRDWGKFRWQDEILSVIWLYNRTGSSYLLDLASLVRSQGYDWITESKHFPYTQRITADFLRLQDRSSNGLNDLALATHGVNNGQAIKAGPVWSQVSRSSEDRDAASRMIAELDRYHGLPNGMFSCDEHFAGRDPSQGSELCAVVEFMFSLEQAMAITGDPLFGDRLEKLAFNALPGAFTDDMWAHQYNQEPNQVECSLHHKPWTTDGPESNLFGLEPNFGCCTANFNQGWPKFTNSLFMASGDQQSDLNDGIVAVAYAPCQAVVDIRGTRIRLTEETEYPFRGTVRITVDPSAPLNFPFELRIPGWAEETRIRVNDQQVAASVLGSFTKLSRTWRSGDIIELDFKMNTRSSNWFHDSIAIERGPLVLSLNISEDWVKLRDRGMTADWQVYPKSRWNYALDLDPNSLEQSITVTEEEVSEVPFSCQKPPVQAFVKARILDQWRAEDGCAAPLPESPVTSNLPQETISLIPYASAKLRITGFPRCKS
jgi:uncharacterized protein